MDVFVYQDPTAILWRVSYLEYRLCTCTRSSKYQTACTCSSAPKGGNQWQETLLSTEIRMQWLDTHVRRAAKRKISTRVAVPVVTQGSGCFDERRSDCQKECYAVALSMQTRLCVILSKAHASGAQRTDVQRLVALVELLRSAVSS